MKPKNFPARKLWRQIIAKYGPWVPVSEEIDRQLDAARLIRSKKRRAG